MIEAIRRDLERFIVHPSVSADPSRAAELRASAESIAAAFADVGVDTEIADAGGGPAVVGRREGPPGSPTVLLYAHHDVQPIGDGWTCDPFALTERDDRWFGRGSADDKGGVAAHLAALREFDGDLPVTVAVLIEGEEEIGSPTLDSILTTHLDRIRADVVLAPDAVNLAALAPSLTVSLRGLLSVVVTVRTADRALHSGIHGGAVPDALGALVRVLDTLVDADGSVAVDGLSDLVESGVRGPDETELRAALLPGTRLVGRGSTSARVIDGAAITITGIDAPSVAQAANALTPEARAAVSVRLAPETDPAEAFAALARHLHEHTPWGAEVTVRQTAGGKGWRARQSSVARLGADALASAFGAPNVELGVGGGIPFVAALTEKLPDAEVLVTAVQDPLSRAHASDESVDPRALVAAARAEADILSRLGRAG
jgi:cysteinylglycine-S-conjugate dipeptidase